MIDKDFSEIKEWNNCSDVQAQCIWSLVSVAMICVI